jgi:hypothetical protein
MMSYGSSLIKYDSSKVVGNIVSAYVTAYEHFNEHRSILKMTTGSASLDSLIDSIQEGQFYLFYGSNKLLLDGLVHGLLVNCVLPKQKHGFESMVLYINNTDYYQPDKSKVLSPERIANTAKCMVLSPRLSSRTYSLW